MRSSSIKPFVQRQTEYAHMHVKTYFKKALQDTLKQFNQSYVISCRLYCDLPAEKTLENALKTNEKISGINIFTSVSKQGSACEHRSAVYAELSIHTMVPNQYFNVPQQFYRIF